MSAFADFLPTAAVAPATAAIAAAATKNSTVDLRTTFFTRFSFESILRGVPENSLNAGRSSRVQAKFPVQDYRDRAMASEPGSLSALREVNRLRVVDALRERGTASRSELAR